MGRFTVIPQETFNELQMDAGVLLKRFNPAAPTFLDEDIITATTGGVNPSCVPEFSDLGEDVDNVPADTKELKHLDKWTSQLTTTALGTSAELIKKALGCADIDAETGAVKPRRDLLQSDFQDLWWVGDRADGGFVAVKLKNALSTGGFSLQTTKNGKGTLALTFTAHVSINNQTEIPMEFYSVDPDESAYTVMQLLTHVTSSYTESGIAAGDDFSATLTAETGYTIENVVVLVGGEDVTDAVYSEGTVTVDNVDGNVVIIATAISNT